MFKTVAASLLALPFTLFAPSTHAQQTGLYLYEAAQADPALAAEFKRVMEPLLPNASWLESFGTTAPPTSETVDGKTYTVYWGCKPHDCIAASYVVMYNPQAKQITGGAFLQNNFDGPNLIKSDITWLGKTDFDAAKVIGKYFF